MLQIKLALLLLGGVATFYGYEEHKLAAMATEAPVAADLAALESGARPTSIHLEIGPHWRLWDQLIYSYTQEKSAPTGGAPGPATKVDYVYYPVVSADHPFIAKWNALLATYGDFEHVPDDEFEPLPQIVMLVRTERFAHVRNLPTAPWERADRLQGLVVNQVRALDADARRLLRESFPLLPLDQVLILEEGRQPTSTVKAMGVMGGGGLLSLLGLASLFLRRR